MSRISKLIAGVLTMGLLMLPCTFNAKADTNSVHSSLLTDSNVPTTDPSLGSVLSDLGNIFLNSKTNWTFVPFAVIAPGAKNGTVGGGIGAFYNINKYVMAGARLEWLDGGWWIPNGTMTLQYPIHPLQFIGTGKSWQQFTFTPLVYGGVGYPLSGLSLGNTTLPGKNNLGTGPIGIAGVGGAASIYSDKNVSIYAVADAEDWTGLPQHVYNIGLAIRLRI